MYSKKQFLKCLFFGITIMLMFSLIDTAPASEQPGTENNRDIDARWLPWIGSWHLVSNRINKGEDFSKQQYLLTMGPGSNENAIIMKGSRDDKVLVEEEIIADGKPHPLKDKKCSGYYTYTWSENGKRLLLESETNCPGDPPRKVSGMSIIDNNRDWLDIQLLRNGKEKAISIRKYRNIDSDDSILSSRFNPDQINISRITAGKNFSISEIIELSSKVEPEVLETALLEIRKPFPINSKQLLNLSDSGVNSRVIDLMVAFSFPDKFTVEQEAVSLVRADVTAGPRINDMNFRYPYHYYPYDYPFLPWHWTSYYPYWSYGYGYSYLGWYLDGSYYYPLWTYVPQEYYYGYGGGGGGGSARASEGVLVKGRGYSRVNSGSSETSPRYAQPRVAPTSAPAPVSSYSSGGSSGSYSSGSSGSSSGGSRSTSSTSSSGSPSASPRGYSRGR